MVLESQTREFVLLKPLSGISKSQTWEFVFSKFKIEESVESELYVVVVVCSIGGSFKIRV